MNPQVSKMTSFIVMDIIDRINEMRKEGIDVVPLHVGEPDFKPCDAILEAAKNALDSDNCGYTHSQGDLELREEICRLYAREYGVSITPERIIVTSGSSPAILMALIAVCEPGSEVIITNPGYACYKNFILAAGCVPVEVSVSARDGFAYPIEELKAAITERTRAVMINSPMNPTGMLLSEDLMREIAKCGVMILSDEIYHGLVYTDEKEKSILNFTDNAFVFNGFSKRYAMTGMRLGYVIVPKDYVKSANIINQNLFICASNSAQKAALAGLRSCGEETEARRKCYAERRVYMLERLREMGFEIECEPMGAFYVFAKASKFTNNVYNFAFDVLEKAHVGITPGVDFGSGGEGYVRFSYACSKEVIKEGLDRLEKYLKERRK